MDIVLIGQWQTDHVIITNAVTLGPPAVLTYLTWLHFRYQTNKKLLDTSNQ